MATYSEALRYLYRKYPDSRRHIYLMPSKPFWALYHKTQREADRAESVERNNLRSTKYLFKRLGDI